LDVVTRYYRFVTCRYTIILMTPCVTRHYHTGWYYEYKETFRHGTNCRVKIAYCYGLRMWIFGETLWTNANGIFRSAHLCWQHTTPEWERHCQPTSCLAVAGQARRRQLKQGGCWVGKVQIKQLAWYLIWLLWLWHGIEACAVMLSACIGQRGRGGALSLTGRLFRASRAASNDYPWDNYRRFASFCASVQLLLWVRSVPVSNECVRRATARPRNVTSIGVESPLLGLLGYIFPFRNTRLPIIIIIIIKKYRL